MGPADSTPCACDACLEQLGAGDAQADGLCAFCARSCFPATRLPGGGLTRTRLSAQSRAAVHAAAAPPAPLAGDEEALRRQLLAQAARAAFDAVRPEATRQVRRAVIAAQRWLGPFLKTPPPDDEPR